MRTVSAFRITLFVHSLLYVCLFATCVGGNSHGERDAERRRPLWDLWHRDSTVETPYEGEVVVSTGKLTVRGPPKGLPERRRSRDVSLEDKLARGSKSKSLVKHLKKMWPYMLVPIMMSMGYAPFLLTTLKTLVMWAMMVNMMALNAAIFLSLRNMVFGPRQGGHVKYYNFGYKHHRSRRNSWKPHLRR